MNIRQTIAGFCLLSALCIGAFAAQGASAATTAFTCSKAVTTKTFSDAHCTKSTGTKEYGHTSFAGKTSISVGSGTAGGGSLALKAVIDGFPVEIRAAGGVAISGSLQNAEPGGEMAVEWIGTATYTGVGIASPLTSCKVYTDNGGTKGEEGVLHTTELKAQTTSEMGVKLEPVTGSVIATFIIDECPGPLVEALNGTWELTGSLIGEPSGGEIIFTDGKTTAQETLSLVRSSNKKAYNAGIVATPTIKNAESGSAIVATTPPYSTD